MVRSLFYTGRRRSRRPDGGEAPYYRIAELWFDTQDTLQATTASPEGQATVADIPNFATGGATVVIAAVD